MGEIERLSTVAVAKSYLPCNWIREGHYDALEKKLFEQEQDRSRERIRLAELEIMNRQLTEELSKRRIPSPEVKFQPGQCECTIKLPALYCQHCGRAI